VPCAPHESETENSHYRVAGSEASHNASISGASAHRKISYLPDSTEDVGCC
jgi:hypothetical protein